MNRAVRYERFGGPDVLEVVEVDPREPGPGEVRVRVTAAGLNPVDYKIFGGAAASRYGATLPNGVGHDFAGIVDRTGEGVTRFSPGQRVYGGKRNEALADELIIHQDDLILPAPDGLETDAAAALAIGGRTACACVDALAITAEDTVLVSAAAGGVGVLASQLAVRRGAVVVGTASEANHEFLRELGIIPVAYGDGLADRVREAAPDGITAAIDTHGPETVDVALQLGLPLTRINTIAARGYRGAQGKGGPDASADDLASVAALVAADELVLPIDSVYPLERAAEAYEHLMAGHVRGKVIVAME